MGTPKAVAGIHLRQSAERRITSNSPDLVPYQELASEIQDYDRNMIRDLLPFPYPRRWSRRGEDL